MNLRATTVAALAGAALLAGCSSGSADPRPGQSSGIGAWPSFLPSPSAASVAHGSATNPALSYAGSPVVVDLGPGTVTMNVQGPSYPADTEVGADQVACTFTVDLSGASRPVDLSRARFDVLDHAGTVHPLRPLAGGALPSSAPQAAKVTFRLVATVPSGEGLLRYAPDGAHTVAAWDYVAETD